MTMTPRLRLVLHALLGYAVLYAFVWLVSESMMYFPPRGNPPPTAPVTMIPVTDDHHIAALYFPHPGRDRVILFSHGNGEDLTYAESYIEMLRDELSISVLGYDYSGYGLSDGSRPSERGTYRDIEAAYRHLIDNLGYRPEDIVVYGRSIGSGPSVWLASRYPVGGLILESPMTSIFRVVLPFPLFPIDRYPNLQRIPDVNAPVLIMQGRDDEVIPFRHGQALYAAAPEPKQNLWVDQAGHNNLTHVAWPAIVDALTRFLEHL